METGGSREGGAFLWTTHTCNHDFAPFEPLSHKWVAPIIHQLPQLKAIGVNPPGCRGTPDPNCPTHLSHVFFCNMKGSSSNLKLTFVPSSITFLL